jgi:hypothetical protein
VLDKKWDITRLQWALDEFLPEKKKEVKAKQMEALKRLGHGALELDEYERMSGNLVYL